MTYPVWYVPFGSAWIIAVIATVHVFISHFAIGGGLMLVLLEATASRHDDEALKGWLKRRSRFFLLLTLVLGALTGVGIWFTISLISPAATSTLIRLFVWVWAIEWVFFLAETMAILVYYYTWDRLDPFAHRIVGWIYFGSAYLSLVAINGILAFQLTPGRWLASGSLWDAFFNPTNLPSLVARTLVCFILAGLFTLFGLAFTKTGPRPDLVRRSLLWVVIPLAFLPLVLFWYFKAIPPEQRLIAAAVPYFNHLALTALFAMAAIALLAAAVWFSRGKVALRQFAAIMLLLGLFGFGSAEWLREDLRLPYLIVGNTYANGVAVSALPELRSQGLLATSQWSSVKAVTRQNEAQAGKEIFVMACSQCHTVRSRLIPLGPRLASLDEGFASWLAYRTDLMRGGMPPFPGTAAEAEAVAHYLRVAALPEAISSDGASVFRRRCGVCHTMSGSFRPLARVFEGEKAEDAVSVLNDLQSFSSDMPKWTGSETEKSALAQWLVAQSNPAKKGAS
jgi:mono/diheme cytochrome c family protein